MITNITPPSFSQTTDILDIPNIIAAVGAMLLLLIVDMIQEHTSVRQLIAQKNIVIRWVIWFVMIFVVMLIGIYGPEYNASSFIYEQF